MADIVSQEKRSEMMSGIRGKDTRPELFVRRGLFGRGFRFRVHVSTLPGRPDVVLPKHRVVIFVNGCFWHGHGCSLFRWPSSRAGFWHKKIGENRKHDSESLRALRLQGWRTLVVWECAMKGKGRWPADKLIEAMEKWIVGGTEWAEAGEQYGEPRLEVNDWGNAK